MQTEIPPSEARETKSRFLSLEVTVGVFRWQVILQCILEKVMDTFIGAEGGPLRDSSCECRTLYFNTCRRRFTFPLNLITDTLFSLFIYFSYTWEYTRNDFPKRTHSNRHRQVYCIGCGPSHFCSKSNEISQMTQAIQICATISYSREAAFCFTRWDHM